MESQEVWGFTVEDCYYKRQNVGSPETVRDGLQPAVGNGREEFSKGLGRSLAKRCYVLAPMLKDQMVANGG